MWEIEMKISILLLAIFAGLGQWGCSGSFTWGDGAASQSGNRIQTVDGRVERVDVQRGTFEVSDPLRARVIVSLPYNARSSDVDRVQTLQAGDNVRVEGDSSIASASSWRIFSETIASGFTCDNV
jgi:hypothetical protein